MRDSLGSERVDMGIVLWLVALSFWSGVSYMQIQNNEQMINQGRATRLRVWDKLDKMQHDLDVIAGYIRGKEGETP